MPDLLSQAFWHCQSAEDWQTTVPSKSGGQPHIVRWTRWGHGNPDVQLDYSCDCKSFVIRGICSHIKQVKAENRRCGWLQFLDGGNVNHDADGKPTCPRCGGPVGSMNWGV